MKNNVLSLLMDLELMRLKSLNGEKNLDDYSVRMCQAKIASNYFNGGRNEWINILKSEYGLDEVYNSYHLL